MLKLENSWLLTMATDCSIWVANWARRFHYTRRMEDSPFSVFNTPTKISSVVEELLQTTTSSRQLLSRQHSSLLLLIPRWLWPPVSEQNALHVSRQSILSSNQFFDTMISSPPVILINRECVIGNCSSTDGNLSDMKSSCTQNVCESLSGCLNTSIQRRSYPPCEVFKAGLCGYGLKVCSDVCASTLIVEYTGEVITASECSDRMRGMKG